MKNLIQLIKERNFTEAENQIDNAIPLIMEKKIFEMKKAVAAKMSEQMNQSSSQKVRAGIMEDEKEESSEKKEKEDDDKEEKEEELDEARINIVRARVRGGKIQRRKRVSNVPGMTLRGGTLKRMSAAERRRRKMGARRGKVKRKAKLSRSLMKRKRSLQKRKSLGL